MLRLPSSPAWLALSPRQVGLARGNRGRVEPLGALDVLAQPGSKPASVIAAVLDAAAELLDEHAIKRTRVHTVLSDRMVRYVLIPFSPAYLDPREERALCLARFAELYGPMSGWPVAIDRARHGKARMACALPLELAQGLTELLAARSLEAGTIVPHFVSSWNSQRRALARQAGILAVIEPDSVVFGHFEQSAWSALRTHFADVDCGALEKLIMRERLHQQCDPATPVWLCGSVSIPVTTDPTVQAIAPKCAEPALAMALAAACP